MDSFEINKIAGAILGALFIVLGLGYVAEGLFHVPDPETPGYEIEIAEAGTGGAAAEEELALDAVMLIASADPSRGESGTRGCVACHSFEAGGANKIGPALHDVMGRDIASVAGFSYSGALTKYGAGKTWTYDLMNAWLENPKGLVSGTSMAYAGMRKPEDRAAMMAYLRALSDNPLPLP